MHNAIKTTLVILTLAFPLFARNADSLAGKKTVFLGDSITQAGGYITFIEYDLDKLFPDQRFDIYGLGLSSETLSGLSEPNHAGGAFPRPCLFERLGRLLDAVKPDVIFACYGINDGIYLPPDPARFDAFKKGVNTLIEQSKAGGVKDIFLITPPIFDFPPNRKGFNYDEVMTQYAAWEMTLKIPGVHVIDLHTPMSQARKARTECFSKDAVHPGEDGHLLMAKTVLTALGIQVPTQTVAEIKADPLYTLVLQKRMLVSDRWMKHVGYTRSKTVAPQPLGNTQAEVDKIQEKIDVLRKASH